MMIPRNNAPPDARATNPGAIQRAARQAVRSALAQHKLLGQPIALQKNGEVVIVPPEEIEVDAIP